MANKKWTKRWVADKIIGAFVMVFASLILAPIVLLALLPIAG